MNRETYIYLLLLRPKTDTHFTVPWQVEVWVNLGGCRECPYVVS